MKMNSTYIEEISRLDRDNFWFKVKRYYLDSIITKKNAYILNVGCGIGSNLLEFTLKNNYVVGIDKSNILAKYCRERRIKCFKLDLEKDLLVQLDFIPDYITALDFLEHIKKPVVVLKKLLLFSGKNTKVILTVPAYQFLWSDWDVFLGHVKRYTQHH